MLQGVVSPLLLTLLWISSNVCAYDISPPVPTLNEDKGIRYPLTASAKGKVKIEAFIELICQDSAAAWPVLQQVADHYGPDNVELVFHQLPLPYHRNAFVGTQGLFVIQDKLPNRVLDYIGHILQNWFMFSGSATRDMVDSEVLDLLGQHASTSTGINADEFKSEISKYSYDTVKIWKYGVSRRVAGTPWYFVNGNDVAINPSVRVSFEDWQRFLDPFFG